MGLNPFSKTRKLRTIRGELHEGNQIHILPKVIDRGDHYEDARTGDIYAKIGTPKLKTVPPLIPILQRPKQIATILLSRERAASFNTPTNFQPILLKTGDHAGEPDTDANARIVGFTFDPPRGSTTVTMGNDLEGYLEVQVTPELHSAIGVEKAARALSEAQEIPWSIRIAYMGLGGAILYLAQQALVAFGHH